MICGSDCTPSTEPLDNLPNVPGGTNGSPTSKFSPVPEVAGCGGGVGCGVSLGPGGAALNTPVLPLPAPCVNVGAGNALLIDACIAATLGSDSAVNLPLKSTFGVAPGNDACNAATLGSAAAFNRPLASIFDFGAVTALFVASGFMKKYNSPSTTWVKLPFSKLLVTFLAVYTLLCTGCLVDDPEYGSANPFLRL